MKLVLNIIGGLMILMGITWILQGLGMLPGRMMSGHIIWAGNGSWLALAGVGLLVWNNVIRKKA